MSDDRLKVKELAGMFDVDPKEMLQELKNMGFDVKVSTSSVPAAELSRIKAHFKGKTTPAATAQAAPEAEAAPGENAQGNAKAADAAAIERKEVQPGVIIRRRRSKDAEAPNVEDAAPVKAELEADPALHAPEAESATEAKPEPETQPKVKEPPKPAGAKIISTPATVAQKQAEEAAKLPPSDTSADPKPAAAKAAAEAEPKKADLKKDVARRIAPPDATFEPDEEEIAATKAVVAAALRAQNEPSDQGTHTHEENKGLEKGSHKKPEATSSHVRIISRPDPVPTLPEPKFGADASDPSFKAGHSAHAPGRHDGAGPSSKVYDYTTERDGMGAKKKRTLGAKRTVNFKDFEDDSVAFDGLEKDELSTDSWGEGAQRPHGRRPRRHRKDHRQQVQTTTQPLKAAKRKIKVDEFIKVGDMAHEMGVKSTEVIKILMQLGVLATINQSLDIDTATLVAAEFEYEIEKVGFSENDYLMPTSEDAPEDLAPRPPVVTIMGHVDHGKTSLLDAIRKSAITEGEAGGITQHIGAYHVTTPKGDIVFLDTPGHEAFTAMRARGAQITDIVILVVAADDGVMEQTREAVSHAQAAGVPIMVAINTIDKEDASPERVTRELSDLGLISEAWGGDTIFSEVSAKTGQGIEELLELLALQSEVMELKANPNKPARGRIVEAKLDKGRGPVATVLIQEGSLKLGDCFVCGVYSGRVRAMHDDQAKNINNAGPSMPVEVHGFEGVPEAGEEFIALADEKLARRIADERAIKLREKELARESKVTLETFLASRPSDLETLVLNLVLKADVQGSLEAITEALKKLGTEEVRVNIVHGGAGSITESDVLLASASNAIIIGFNVRPTAKVKDLAEQEKVEIRFYDIIYNLSDEIKKAMEGLLAPVVREVYLGQAEVRQTFSVPKVGTIAGCFVNDGKITRNAQVRLLREGVVVYTGKISSLKRFKDDAREVLKGYECGLSLENFNDLKVADVIEAFETVEEAATL